MTIPSGQITQAEREARLAGLRRAIHSAEVEGGYVPEDAVAIICEYAEGRITIDEAERRMTVLYGLDA